MYVSGTHLFQPFFYVGQSRDDAAIVAAVEFPDRTGGINSVSAFMLNRFNESLTHSIPGVPQDYYQLTS